MRKQTWLRAGVLGLAVAVVAGCGAVVREAVAREEAVGVVGGYALAGAAGGAHLPGRPGRVLAHKLGLTAEQQARLYAIAGKYRGELHPASLAARQELAAIALAPEVDQARLTAFIQAQAAAFEARKPARLALAGELRAALTPAQRETLAGLLEAGGSSLAAHLDTLRGEALARATTRLGLTPLQREKVAALQARVDALRADPRKDALRLAAAAFVRTGDADALSAALPAPAEVVPVPELVAVAASLDLAQRRQIAAHVRRFAARHR